MTKIWSGGASESNGPDLSSLMTGEDNAIDQNLINYEIEGLIAYHLELSKSSVLSSKESRNILEALLELLNSGLHMGDQYEDVHSLVQEKVKELTPSGDNLRVFLSRNDQSHFDIRSFYMDALLKLTQELTKLSTTIHETFGSLNGFMPGYTHYRQAMPMAVATYFDYLAASFFELAQEVFSLYEKFKKFCPLGYGSGYGSAVKVDLHSLAKRLGFESYFVNPVLGASHRGLDEVDMASLENKIMLIVSRMSQDFIQFSSEEFGFLILPDGFTTGSSLMPNKRNPDFLEMLEGYASESLGVLTTSITILMNKGLGYHREFQLSKDKVISYTLRLSEMLKALNEMLAQIKIDSEKAQHITENSTNATMNAFELFSSGTPWKEAYSEIGSKVRRGEFLEKYEPEISESFSVEHINALANKVKLEIEKRDKAVKNLLAEGLEFSKNY